MERKNDKEKGFTLIGLLIGVAIMGLLAASFLPDSLQTVMRKANQAEQVRLASMDRNLRSYILENRQIPDAATWGSAIANYSSINAANITASPSGEQRIYVYPSNFIGNNKSLPYNQATEAANGNFLNSVPSNPRAMIITNLTDKPFTTNSGSLSTFDNVWNQTGSFPSELTEGVKVVIQRINLADSFSPVTLSNNDTVNSAKWKIDSSPVQSLPNSTTVTNYFLNGTDFKLLDNGDNVSAQQTVMGPLSFIFNGSWGGTLGGTNNTAPAQGGLIGSIFGGQNGSLNNWNPDPSCSPTGNSYRLTVRVTNNQANASVYNGGTSGNPNRLETVQDGNSDAWYIRECTLVIISGTGGSNPYYNVFYMPHNNLTVNVP